MSKHIRNNSKCMKDSISYLSILFIERHDFVEVELVSPVLLQHVGIQRAMRDCLHDVVGRIEEDSSDNPNRRISQFHKCVAAAGVRGTEECQS